MAREHTQTCFIELAPNDGERTGPLGLGPISTAVFLVIIGKVGFGVQDSPADQLKIAEVQQGAVLVVPSGKIVKMVASPAEKSAIVQSICPDGFQIMHD